MINALIVYFAARAGTTRALRRETQKQRRLLSSYEEPEFPLLEKLYVVAGLALTIYILLK